MTPYTPAEQREFIDSHIAHRLTALLSVFKRQQDPGFFRGKGDLYCGCVEGAFIMLRVFIEFLGVESRWERGTLTLAQRKRAGNGKLARDTDVMLDCFDLPLVTPNDFGGDQALIARVHDGLSKSTAHFTFRTGHAFCAEVDFHPAVAIVLNFLNQRFFLPLRESPRFHPDLPI